MTTSGCRNFSWFEHSDRIYFPLRPIQLTQNDIYVIQFLEHHGFQLDLDDYIRGHARRVGAQRVTRIGSILGRLGEDGAEILKLFNISPIRVKGNFLVVLSCRAEDIAKMSEDRRWVSCLTNESAETAIEDEIEEGGFVAYLIYDNDLDIKKPLSRILIRRFVSPDRDSIAVPENVTFGIDIPEFAESVSDWIDNHQDIPDHYYERKGMRHSDSLDNFITFGNYHRLLQEAFFKNPDSVVSAFRYLILSNDKESLSFIEGTMLNDEWEFRAAARMIFCEARKAMLPDDFAKLKRAYNLDPSDYRQALYLLRILQTYDIPLLPYLSRLYFVSTRYLNGQIVDIYVDEDGTEIANNP